MFKQKFVAQSAAAISMVNAVVTLNFFSHVFPLCLPNCISVDIFFAKPLKTSTDVNTIHDLNV